MKLAHVYASMQAWKAVCGLKLKPKVAYAIMKYTGALADDYRFVESQRVAIIRDVAGVGANEDAKLEFGTPEFTEYARQFGAVLKLDSDLQPFSLSMDEFMDAVGEYDENTVTTQQLVLLEPFMKDSGSGKEEVDSGCDKETGCSDCDCKKSGQECCGNCYAPNKECVCENKAQDQSSEDAS